VFNPEPLAPFMDFFVIGDGEDVIARDRRAFAGSRARPAPKLEALAKIEGVYVPALYPFETLPDGRIVPALDAPKIRKRITRDLDGATFPTEYIVPFTQQVHDRVEPRGPARLHPGLPLLPGRHGHAPGARAQLENGSTS
jgi:radical SAM superfamily enzyme YgiQ (UPF0313 family)